LLSSAEKRTKVKSLVSTYADVPDLFLSSPRRPEGGDPPFPSLPFLGSSSTFVLHPPSLPDPPPLFSRWMLIRQIILSKRRPFSPFILVGVLRLLPPLFQVLLSAFSILRRSRCGPTKTPHTAHRVLSLLVVICSAAPGKFPPPLFP